MRTNVFGRFTDSIISRVVCALFNSHPHFQFHRNHEAEAAYSLRIIFCLPSSWLLWRWLWDKKKNEKKFGACKCAVLRQLCYENSNKMRCRGAGSRYHLLHVMIALYVAVTTKLEDVSSAKKGSWTAMPRQMLQERKKTCHRILVHQGNVDKVSKNRILSISKTGRSRPTQHS